MKVYIAGSFPSRERLRPMGDALWQMGIQVMSSWLNEVQRPEHLDLTTFQKKLAIKDIAEVYAADILIVDTLDAKSGGGKYTETGVALGRFQNALVYRVGPVTNVFHHLCDQAFADWDEALAFMKKNHSRSLAIGSI